MNFNGNFSEIGRTDVGELRRLVERLTPNHWNADSLRQRRYEAHKDTQTYPLVFDADFRHTHPTRRPQLRVFEPAIRATLAMIADHYERSAIGRQLCADGRLGYFVRASLIRLVAGGEIAAHQDNNFSLAHSHRVHVPVVTNERVRFSVGSETIHMPEGSVYEINNRRLHSVTNGGVEGRVHLVVDFVLPGEPCCCSAKTHPDVPCSPRACAATDRLKVPCTCYSRS